MTSKFKKGCLWGAASGTALICALAASGSAHASGFQVRETSGTLQGSSFAGHVDALNRCFDHVLQSRYRRAI